MAELHQHLALQAGGVGQAFNGQQPVACKCGGHGQRDGTGTARGDEAGLGPGGLRHSVRGQLVQVLHLDKFAGDGGHRGDGLGHHDRGAEHGHGARSVDDRPQAELAPDVAHRRLWRGEPRGGIHASSASAG